MKLRVVKAPNQVRKKLAQDVAKLENESGLLLRGYARRTEANYVEVVLVTNQTTEAELATALVGFIQKWKVDAESIVFEERNLEDAHFLNESKFKVVQANGEPEGFSNFFEDNDAFTVVSSLR